MTKPRPLRFLPALLTFMGPDPHPGAAELRGDFPGQYAVSHPAHVGRPVWPAGCDGMLNPLKRAACLDFIAKDFGRLDRYAHANAVLAAPLQGERRVVFFGDSITDNWSMPEFGGFFPGRPYVNRGIGGQTTSQMLLRFRADVLALGPSAVVILAGTNDVGGNGGPYSERVLKDNLQSMAELAKLHGIAVVLAGLLPTRDGVLGPHGERVKWSSARPPSTLRALNDWLREYATAQGHVYLDYATSISDSQGALRAELTYDGLHPNADGYAAMAPLAESAIARALAGRGNAGALTGPAGRSAPPGSSP